MTIEERVINESNDYFERNKNSLLNADEKAKNAYSASDFIEKYLRTYPGTIEKVLEIGCNYGYNIDYLARRHGIECWGIEPSDKAVEYGISRWKESNPRVHIMQGISNKLPYKNSEFDVVMMGFLMYVTPREMIADTVLEVNRVLKEGGFLILTDFDTPISYKRINKHNDEMPVYKEDYSRRFIPMGYSVVEKISFSNSTKCFNPEIQERMSTQFLYKEKTENLYINN